MSFMCNLGLHKWNGCKCNNCGAMREDAHQWRGCKCSICGAKRDEGHNWDGCVCEICGKKDPDDFLFRAIFQNNLLLIKKALAAGANVNSTDEAGATPLMAAVGQRNIEAAKILLAAGADVNAKSQLFNKGITALMIATHTGDTDMVKLLQAPEIVTVNDEPLIKSDLTAHIKQLDSHDAEERALACVALGNSGDPSAVLPLIAALQDTHEYVGKYAAEALGTLGDTRAIEPLTKAEKNHSRLLVAVSAQDALKSIRAKM